jgi:hypothetical protein
MDYRGNLFHREFYHRNPDTRLRQLERQALSSTDPNDTYTFLAAAHRAGFYHVPLRSEIRQMLRSQVKGIQGRRMFSPRYYYAEDRVNTSNLQHPSEAGLWGGDYGDWNDALRDAQPGDVFEVNHYYWASFGGRHIGDGEWNLDGIIELSVPMIIYNFKDRHWDVPPNFESYPQKKKKERRKP